ncbi:MAG: BrnT family toxin [bacterium]
MPQRGVSGRRWIERANNLDRAGFRHHGPRVSTVVFGDFEWDDRKAVANLRNHGVAFEEAVTALADPRAITAPDFFEVRRCITIGLSGLLRVLFVVHTESVGGGRVRIISARRASTVQRRRYEET